MIDVINLEEMPECIMELGGRVEILSSQDMASCVFPESFNNIEIRGIRRQKYEGDSKFSRLVLYSLAMLVPRALSRTMETGELPDSRLTFSRKAFVWSAST